VNAGIDQTLCSISPQAQLAGVVGGGASSGTWSGGSGSFNPGASSLNATYTPTAAEIAAGGVTLTLTTNDPAGPCAAATDQVRINILPGATVNAGVDQTVCASSAQVQLAATMARWRYRVPPERRWGSFSPNASNPNAVYTPAQPRSPPAASRSRSPRTIPPVRALQTSIRSTSRSRLSPR
jgi:hypothetical protein